MSNAPTSPRTGQPTIRAFRPLELSRNGKSITVQMPGWYGTDPDDSVHTGEDRKVSDVALAKMRA